MHAWVRLYLPLLALIACKSISFHLDARTLENYCSTLSECNENIDCERMEEDKWCTEANKRMSELESESVSKWAKQWINTLKRADATLLLHMYICMNVSAVKHYINNIYRNQAHKMCTKPLYTYVHVHKWIREWMIAESS